MESREPIDKTIFESSLEIKCLSLFGLALTVVIAVSFYLYFRVTKAQILAQTPQMANLLVEQDMIQKHIETLADHELINERSRENFTDSLESMTYFDNKRLVESLIDGIRTEKFQSRTIRSKYYRNMIKSQNSTDFEPQSPFEHEVLEDFQAVPQSKYAETLKENEYRDRIDDETGEYHYLRAIRVSDHRCTLSCHLPEQPDDSPVIGDLIGVIHVTIPRQPAKNAIAKNWALLLGISIITAFFTLIAFYGAIRLVVIQPLRTLRDVAESISRGDLTKRADLHSGDEFESLGTAFNRMLRHLVSTQEQLRKANTELEFKVDELAHLTALLHETNRLKSDFMATMSHELRTPLNSILGFSDVLRSISTLTEKQKRYVENIAKSGRTLLHMINDILDMAKLESGRMETRLTDFHIAHIIAAQSDMARPLLDRKNIDIAISIPPDLPPMHQDESRLQQILNNLLSNAIKFTPEGGRITVSVARIEAPPLVTHDHEDGETIAFMELKVVDTGVGISEEDQAIVFEKFRQAKSSMTGGDTMKREYSGSGLGLSIVKELCRMLEGKITLESQLGLGSTFTVRLPWTLTMRSHGESEMMLEIQEFSKTRLNLKPPQV